MGILTAILAFGGIVTAIVGVGILFAMSTFELEPGAFEGEPAERANPESSRRR